LGASTPSRSKSSGWRRGSSIISRTFRTSSPRPPMSSYVTRGIFVSPSFAGFSAILSSVRASTRTASALGLKDVTTKSNFRPMMLTVTMSPRVRTRPRRVWAMKSSPPMIRTGSVGARLTFSAGRATAFRRPTFSSIPTSAFRRWAPSSRMIPRFTSSGSPVRTRAAVSLPPSTRTTSSSRSSRIFMTSGSTRTIPRPASAGRASATRRNRSWGFMGWPQVGDAPRTRSRGSHLEGPHKRRPRPPGRARGAGAREEGGWGPDHSTRTLTGSRLGIGSFFGTRTSRTPSFSFASVRSATTSSGRGIVRWKARYALSRE